jgi:hypothetical protein
MAKLFGQNAQNRGLPVNLSGNNVSTSIFLDNAKHFHVQCFYSASVGGTGSFRLESSVISGTLAVSGTAGIAQTSTARVWNTIPGTTVTNFVMAAGTTGSLDWEVPTVAYPRARLVYVAESIPPTGSLYGEVWIKE